MEQNDTTGFGQITKVKRHHIETVNIYEVSDSELRELEMGNDADTFLNIGLSCLSFAIAFFLSILSSTFKNEYWKLLICCVTVIFGLAGVIMLVLWTQKRKSKKSIIETIRNRGKNKEQAAQNNNPTTIDHKQKMHRTLHSQSQLRCHLMSKPRLK